MSFLHWSIVSERFLSTNLAITRLVLLIAFLPNDSLWQPSTFKGFTLILESLQIPITVSSRFWSEVLLEIPDMSTLFGLFYCSDLNCCFSRFTILFWRFWLAFLTIHNSLFKFLLAVMRQTTFSESLEIWLYYPWISLPTTTFLFKFSKRTTRSFFFIPLMAL